jgi:hypothetical protein
MSLVLLVTAFLGFNSMTGSEPIQTVISAPVVDEPVVTTKTTGKVVIEVAEVLSPVPTPKAKVNTQEIMDDLAFESAQLESAMVMLETLQLIEGKE